MLAALAKATKSLPAAALPDRVAKIGENFVSVKVSDNVKSRSRNRRLRWSCPRAR